jgi:hypothetical protein
VRERESGGILDSFAYTAQHTQHRRFFSFVLLHTSCILAFLHTYRLGLSGWLYFRGLLSHTASAYRIFGREAEFYLFIVGIDASGVLGMN